MYQAKVTEMMKLTNEPGTKSPWAQSGIIINVDNVSENVFSIRKDSNFSKMVFLCNVEEWRALNIGGVNRCGFVVKRNLFFVSRSSSRVFGIQISVGSRKIRSLGRHDESSGQCNAEEKEVWSGEWLYGREVSNFREHWDLTLVTSVSSRPSIGRHTPCIWAWCRRVNVMQMPSVVRCYLASTGKGRKEQ
jgi:hypothetical protein